MKYLDFDLSIEPCGDRFAARVFNSPSGQASSEFVLPFSGLELENVLLRVAGRTRKGALRRRETSELSLVKKFGGQLFEAVFNADVRACLRSSLDEAQRQECGLRVRLHLARAPRLADLPWEFLYNASLNRFLCLSVSTPVVRYIDFAEPVRPLVLQAPLRVLLMISSPSDREQLDVSREAGKLEQALADLSRVGLVQVDRVEDATLAELQRRLRATSYHIFHFVGHGGFDQEAQDGVLVLEDAENRAREVSVQFLGALLRDHRSLRLAVLNACEGGRGSGADPFAGMAQGLVQQGIPAVIAMQFEVTDESAICFSHEFYAALAAGFPVDAAVGEARKAIFAQVSEVEWATPVLYMRAPDGRIFDVQQIDPNATSLAGLIRARLSQLEPSPSIVPQVAARAPDSAPALLVHSTPPAPLAAAPAPRFVRPRPGRLLGPLAILAIVALGVLVLSVAPVTMSERLQHERVAATHPADSPAQGSGAPSPATPPSARAPAAAQLPTQRTPGAPAAPAAQRGPTDTTLKRAAAARPEHEADSDEAKIRRVLAEAAQAEHAAFEALTTHALEEVYAGEALGAYTASLQQLASAQQYELHQLHSQRIDGVGIVDAGRARASVHEVWSIERRRKNGQCVLRFPRYSVSQTAFLRFEAGTWKIHALRSTSPPPTSEPCP